MPKPKPMTGHVRTPEKDSIASVINFDPPVKIQAIRIANRLVASDSIVAEGIDVLPNMAIGKFETSYEVSQFSRLIVNTEKPTSMTVEWTPVPE